MADSGVLDTGTENVKEERDRRISVLPRDRKYQSVRGASRST